MPKYGICAVLVVMAAAFLTFGCSSEEIVLDGGDGGAADAGSDGGASRFPACDKSASTQTITFVHVNDTHASYAPDGAGTSPLARFRGYYEAVKKENPFTVFTNAGDDFEKGSVAEILSEGRSTLELARAMQYDVRTIGNHDYAWNEPLALEYSIDPYSVVLESNMKYTGSGKMGWVDYAEMQVGCVKVGFFGMVGQPWNELDQQFDGDYYPDIQYSYDYVTAARAMVKAHGKSVDLMVMVSHVGIFDDKDIGDQVGGIDIILGGHTHTLTENADTSTKAVIVQVGAFSEYVGRMDVKVDLATRNVTDVQWKVTENKVGELPESAAMQATVEGVMKKYAPDADKPVGKIKNSCNEPAIAQVTAKAAKAVLSADAALIDGRTIWSNWAAGDISVQGLFDTYLVEREKSGTPGFNSAYLVDITGADLLKLKATASTNWTVDAPDAIDSGKTYVLATQKRTAMHPEIAVTGVVFSNVRPAYEMWDVLNRWAALRTPACYYLDTDDKIPGC